MFKYTWGGTPSVLKNGRWVPSYAHEDEERLPIQRRRDGVLVHIFKPRSREWRVYHLNN